MSKTIIEMKLTPEGEADRAAYRRLAVILKRLLRDHGWRCLSIRELPGDEDEPRPIRVY